MPGQMVQPARRFAALQFCRRIPRSFVDLNLQFSKYLCIYLNKYLSMYILTLYTLCLNISDSGRMNGAMERISPSNVTVEDEPEPGDPPARPRSPFPPSASGSSPENEHSPPPVPSP